MGCFTNDIAEYYDSVAYEFSLKHEWVGEDLAVLRRFVATLGLSNITRLIDIGCGPAKTAYFFAEAGFEVLALDPSVEMLNVARSSYAHPRITYRQLTLEELLSDHPCNEPVGLLLLFSLIHYPRERFISLMGAVHETFPVGTALLLASQANDPEVLETPLAGRLPVCCWRVQDLHRTLETIGYEIVSSYTRPPRHTEIPRQKHFTEMRIR